MRLGPRDALVALAGTLACAVFVAAFLADANSGDPDARGQPIGVLVVKKRIAQRRPASRSLWISLEREQPLYDLDAVRTDSGSEALVRLNDQTEIQLSENSLVVFDFSGKRQFVDFVEGSVSARRSASAADPEAASGSLVVRAERVELALESGSMRVSAAGEGAVSVAVAEGQIVAKDSKGESAVGPDRSLDISGALAVAKSVNLAPLSPVEGSALLGGGSEGGVGFTWRAYDAAPPYTVEASRTRAFLDSRVSATPLESASLPLEAGEWYWRVVDSRGTSSAVSAFRLLSASPPRPLSPGEGAVLTLGGAEIPRLAWEAVEGASAYEYEVSAGEDFSLPFRSGRAASASAGLKDLAAGEYRWRVRARFDYGGVSSGEYSVPRAFSLRAPERFAAPVLLEPAPDARFEVAAAREGLVFSWSQEGARGTYELFVGPASAPESARSVWSGERSWARVSLGELAGDYAWYVVARPAAGQDPLSSPTARFSLSRAEAPLVLGPADGAEFEAGAEIAFTWSARGETRLGIYGSPEAGRPVTGASSAEGRAYLSLGTPGVYWWRLEGPDAVASNLRRLVVTEALAAPTGLSPREGTLVEALPERSILLEWKPVPGASAYHLVLRPLAGDRAEIRSRVLGLVESVPFSRLDPGDYSLQVYAERGAADGGARFGPAASVRFSIAQARALAAPRLRAPESGTTLDMTRANALDFAWDPVAGANAYELELRRIDSGRLVFRRQLGATTRFSYRDLVNLDRGAYALSLRAAYRASDGVEERSSPASAARFTLEAASSSAAPTLLSPREIYVIEP